MFSTCLENVRARTPLVHSITNYVTVNDVANILLACGGRPIMSDDIGEVEEIASICGGVNINIGTLSQRTIPAMFAAGKRANALRTRTAQKLTEEVRFTAIRGNISEIKALVAGDGSTKGVDADVADTVTEESLDEAVAFAKAAAVRYGAIMAITGAIDLVADAGTCYVIRNGRAEMGRITGTGCQLSGLLTAYLVANPGSALEAAAAAVTAMGLAGELGWGNMAPTDGNATYRNRIIDAIYRMDGAALEGGARYEVR